MEISYYIFLYIYFGLLVVFLIFSFFNIFHVFRYGFFNLTTILMAILFLTITVTIIYYSYQQTILIDWQNKIEINWPSLSSK